MREYIRDCWWIFFGGASSGLKPRCLRERFFLKNFGGFGLPGGHFGGSFWVFWKPRGAPKTISGVQNPFLGGGCVKEGSL